MPFKDDKPKDAENTDFQAGSDNTPMAPRSALQNAASVASMVLTTESIVADKEDPNAAPAMPAGGMGGGMGMY